MITGFYGVCEFPDVQFFMEEDWFEEEAILINSEEGLDMFGSSAYMIPIERLKPKFYTKNDIIDLLRSMSQAIDPTLYKSSENLITEDFFDLALCKAGQYGITEQELWYDDPNFNYTKNDNF